MRPTCTYLPEEAPVHVPGKDAAPQQRDGDRHPAASQHPVLRYCATRSSVYCPLLHLTGGGDGRRDCATSQHVTAVPCDKIFVWNGCG